MNETLDDQSQGPGPAPHGSHLHQDLDRLRRSTTNRYIAGVAGGLGRHFNIDPTIIRVLLVVLTFFGGAGLVVYVVGWLFVPEDGAEHAVIHVGTEPRKILLLAAAGVAVLLVVGNAFSGFHGGWSIVVAAVVLALVLIGRDRRHHRAAAPPWPQPPVGTAPGGPAPSWTATGPTTATTAGPAYATSDAAGDTTLTTPVPTEDTRVLDPLQPALSAPPPAQPPTGQPPVARPPLVPPHRKRTGIIWFWPTLALIAVALGVLGLYDHDHQVVVGAYPALALAVTGVMLLVGSIVGRPGGLILIGFLSSCVLLGNVVVGSALGVDAREMQETPTTAAAVRSDYANTVGDITLDLTQVSDPQALAGRSVDVHLRTGSIEVIVPRSLNVDVGANVDVAGGIDIPGYHGGGFNLAVHRSAQAVPASTAPPLELDLMAKLGQITVEYR